MEDFINMIINLMDRVDLKEVILGAILGWFVTLVYFRLSMKDFFAHRRLSILTYLGLENAGLVRFIRDEKGHLRGLEINLDDDPQPDLPSDEQKRIETL